MTLTPNWQLLWITILFVAIMASCQKTTKQRKPSLQVKKFIDSNNLKLLFGKPTHIGKPQKQ